LDLEETQNYGHVKQIMGIKHYSYFSTIHTAYLLFFKLFVKKQIFWLEGEAVLKHLEEYDLWMTISHPIGIICIS